MRRYVDTCDRCGGEYENSGARQYDGFQFFTKIRKREPNGPKFEYGKKMFLCPTCEEELESWAFEENDQDDEQVPEPEN